MAKKSRKVTPDAARKALAIVGQGEKLGGPMHARESRKLKRFIDQSEGPGTVEEAKAHLRAKWNNGTDCPACGQLVKLYRRRLGSSMAYALILIHKAFKRDTDMQWLHVEQHLKDMEDLPSAIRGDFAKLKHWGFIEPHDGEREDGSPRNGYYRITEKGERFATGATKAAAAFFMFNNRVYGWDAKRVSIDDALGAQFDYSELMGGMKLGSEGAF